MPETKTTPPSVQTPITDANPTAAEMLNGVPVMSSDSTPPMAANGSIDQHQAARAASELNAVKSSARMINRLIGMITASRCSSLRRLSYSPAHS